ncbi:MAG TPA: KR domain-containing protein [Bryobacteraceae bacterium]|jgi:NAD(P)-dependent dehydrogenase (short-subunit alcohol dehydrogenase family)|nr:KR domain-containing protein [Bryobacteraceae bacterium]
MPVAALAKSRVKPVDRFIWFPAEVAPVPELPNPKLAGRRILIAGGREETAEQIARVLREQGAAPLRFSREEDRQHGAALRERFGHLDGIIDLNLEEPLEDTSGDAWEEALRGTLTVIRAYYEEWATEHDAERLFYMPVTRMGGRMGYDSDAVSQPLGGIWAGLAKTLPREIPNCNVRILDLGPGDVQDIGNLVARELYHWGLFEIGYRNGRRYSLCAHQQETGVTNIRLSAEDVVLLSGGARGIGFALAKDLARTYGCRIVITGRTPVPATEEPWLRINETEFKQYRQKLMKDAAGSRNLARVRREIEQIRKRRELFQHLLRVQAESLPITYRECDVTSAEAVRELIDQIGSGLSVVIHNAGVDAPIRLPAKSDDSFVATVRTKIDGFFHLMAALEGRKLKAFCNVGSLTGRWGGMVGETDYAAANEGLSRLGLWAAPQVPFPVKTICWPTWERLGMIKNFDTATAYSSALSVEEGTRKWKKELLHASSGEVMFMGALGNAVSPLYLKGFPPIPDAANIGALYSQFHYLGDVVEFQPFQTLRSRHRIAAGTAPLMQEFRVDGASALPVSILLDYAIAAGEWTQPEGPAPLHLIELREIAVNLDALKSQGPVYEFFRSAKGQWAGDSWEVDVRFGAGTTEPVAWLRLVYGKQPADPAPVHAREMADHRTALPVSMALRWTGIHMKKARWGRSTTGLLVGEARGCPQADLWSTPYLPDAYLPHAPLENAISAALGLASEPEGRWLKIARLVPQPNPHAADLTILGNQRTGAWWIVDREGQEITRLEGLHWRRS